MNTLKYNLEYHCYPIWNYDATGELIDNDLPDDLRNDQELDSLLLKVQEIFGGLYIDTATEFSSHGFHTETERQDFLSTLFTSVEILRNRYGDTYLIECKYDTNSFPVESGKMSGNT